MFDQDFVSSLADVLSAKIVAKLTSEGSVGSQPRLLTLAGTATYLGRSVRAIEHMIAKGVIQVTKLDGRRQVDRLTLDKLINDRTYYET